MKRTILSMIAAGALLAGCGSSKSSTNAPAAGATAKPATETTNAAAVTTAAKAAVTTAAKAATATTAASKATTAATQAAAASTGGGTEVTMKEWSIAVGGTIAAGATKLTIKNAGQNPHELKIIKGDGFASLPMSGGAVDESKLTGGEIVFKTDRIGGGATASLDVNLAAGKYVFVCNLGNGPNSHAAKGQHLDVTVG